MGELEKKGSLRVEQIREFEMVWVVERILYGLKGVDGESKQRSGMR